MQRNKYQKQINIVVYAEGHASGMLDINSEDYPMHFASIHENGPRGLQCSWIGDTPKHALLMSFCEELTTTIRKIHKLHEE